jgi:uncharacterized coiled-coil protein SlyX
MDQSVEQWHLSKSVPVSIIVFLLFQTLGLIVWAVRLDARVERLELSQPLQDQRLTRLEDIYAKVAVIEANQKNVITRLDIQTKTMQEILNLVGNSKTFPRQ